VERRSEHPLAEAVVNAAAARQLAVMPAVDVTVTAGRGLRGIVGGRLVLIGSAAFLRESGVAPFALTAIADTIAQRGQTAILVAVDAAPAGVIAVADTLRETSTEAVRGLEALGLTVVVLSGDRQATAEAIARQAGITRVIADVLPAGKVDAIASLQADGRRVVMVGDGLNDAPALARADVGMAMASGTDVAADAADVTLMRDDLRGVTDAIRLARRTMRIMKQNLFWAFAYNVVGIPIAAGALYPAFGILLSPIIASAAMAFSSVSVVSNSLRLRRG
jgi:Cu+-exporting ATPase